MPYEPSKEALEAAGLEPRAVLAGWANDNDEWIRCIVRHVLNTGRTLPTDLIDGVYKLFRQEKSLDERILPNEPMIEIETSSDAAEEPLAITKISEVKGVNALIPGSVIEPHAGLTILFGENGTGKTGYSRIFKSLANSRTADTILGNIASEDAVEQSAKIEYMLGTDAKETVWRGERGKAPFTRMSIFDSPSVNFHVDDELEYVYVPAALALFNHVAAGIKAVQTKIEFAISELKGESATLLGRFPRDSNVYPLIETLGAATDLIDLQGRAQYDPDAPSRIDALRKSVAALEADTIGSQIALRSRFERVLAQACEASDSLGRFDVGIYNDYLNKRTNHQADYRSFRAELFAAADLPAEPEETWETFIVAGEEYRKHLDEIEEHNPGRCLYCRQPLNEPARELVRKYGEYVADKISQDIETATSKLATLTEPVRNIDASEISAFVKEYRDREDQPSGYALIARLEALLSTIRKCIAEDEQAGSDISDLIASLEGELRTTLASTSSDLTALREQSDNRVVAIERKKKEISELVAGVELSKSWGLIEGQVRNAKEASRMTILSRSLPTLSRSVTELSKTVSDQLINQSFDQLFMEECAALRAPNLKLQFVGRQGKAHRRKVLSGKHKPSKVLSEGEQKVLAIADFLAEARLAGINAPIIFDDPVSSLDHRRISEVARRVALLTEGSQVIVFTHDIFFATTLLSLFEVSKRCSYFQVSDEDGIGKVTRATGPRWDTLASLKKKINESIQSARLVDGEARAALVRTGYDWIRAWCEVFTETELLKGVTQRYQPHVRMTVLPNIKAGALPAAAETVTRIFEEACRCVDAHSQPLPALGVSPTLLGLEAHWQELQECKKTHDSAIS